MDYKEKVIAILNSKELSKEQEEKLEYIFPELKESEDERIRKELIEQVVYIVPNNDEVDSEGNVFPTYQKRIDKYRAWLEKQGEKKPADKIQLGKKYMCIASPRYSTFMIGEIYKPEDKFLCSLMNFCYDCFEPIEDGEQKPADKVEPKFHEGDWTVSNLDGRARQISEVHSDEYNSYYVVDGKSVNLEEYDRLHHLWTIQDAKDGDVLACNEEILLFKSYSVQGRISLYCWYNGQTNNFHNKEVVDTLLTTRNKVCPATKEQRDLLFKKMKEAGYEWDSEKKELKEIEQTHSWSEEDGKILKEIITDVKFEGYNNDMQANSYKKINWLKSIKDRVQPQSQWKPSDEQIKVCKEVYADILSAKGFDLGTINSELNRLEEELKKLRKE